MTLRHVWNWTTAVVLAVVVAAAFLAPTAVIRSQQQETDRVIARIEVESRKIVRASVSAIVCTAAVPPEEREPEFVVDCIDRAFNDP